MLPRSSAAGLTCVLTACVLLAGANVAAEEGDDPQDRAEAAADEATVVVPDEVDSMIGDALLGDEDALDEETADAPEEPAAPESGAVEVIVIDEVIVTDEGGGDSDEDQEYNIDQDAIDEGMEVIIVMANKRAENIQEVPVSMTALDGAFLEKAGLTDFKDIQKFVSNLTIEGGTDTRSTSVRIRGIGSVGTNAGIDPSVGLFIDGVYQGRAGMSMGDLIDISAVEVLRGPQGTLYGKNTAAGLISIRTMRPEYEFSTFGEFIGGSNDTLGARASLNIPIVDERVATRIAGYRSLRDGWDTNLIDNNDVNDLDKWGVRNKWLFDISDDVSLLISGDYAKEDSKCCAPDIITYEGDSLLWRGVSPGVNPIPDAGGGDYLNPNFAKLAGYVNPGPPDPVIGNTRVPAQPELRNFRPFDDVVDVDRKPENEVQIWGTQAELDVAIGEWDLNWLTAFRAYDTESQFDGDFSQYNAVVSDTEEDLEQVSTELRLQSPLGELVDLTAGLFFFYLNHETVGHIGFEQDYADIFITPFEPAINNDVNRHRTYSYAGYTQFNVNISEAVRFTGGIRLSHERKTLLGSQVSTSKLPAPPVGGVDIFRDESRNSTNVSGTARLQVFPTEDTMVYASFASGFKSGGFNQLRTAQAVTPEFDDEEALNYELGMRSTWLDGMLTFNMTGYFTDYTDFQAQSFSGTSITIRNAGSFFSYGLESDMILAPIENLLWRTQVGLNITRYDEFDEAENTVQNVVDLAGSYGFAPFTFQQRIDFGLVPGVTGTGQDLEGKRLDNAPRFSLSTSLDYEWPILQQPYTWVFHTDYSYQSSLFLNQDLDRTLREDPRHLIALRSGIKEENDAWELLFYVTNLLDEEYMVAGFDVPVLGGFAGLHGDPRQYGANLRLRF
jgi:iron complex outermembrane receptor protein